MKAKWADVQINRINGVSEWLDLLVKCLKWERLEHQWKSYVRYVDGPLKEAPSVRSSVCQSQQCPANSSVQRHHWESVAQNAHSKFKTKWMPRSLPMWTQQYRALLTMVNLTLISAGYLKCFQENSHQDVYQDSPWWLRYGNISQGDKKCCLSCSFFRNSGFC